MDAVTGRAEFIYTPQVNLDWSRAYLEQLVATDPEGIHIVVWNRAGFHPHNDDTTLPSAVRILPLPPYSPELNPAELLWNPVKRETANHAWNTLDQIEEAITRVIQRFWESTERVASLVARSWITSGVHALLRQNTSPVSN